MSPPVVTFYSFKGGVGRTAALANVAIALARDRKQTVLVIDMDMDAPGLTMWLPPARSHGPRHGLIDLVEEALRRGELPIDLAPYLYDASPRWMADGRVLVMPAGETDSSYAEKLSRLDWTEFFEQGNGAELFRHIVETVAGGYGADVVLVDARTGFTDPGAVAVRVLADLTVLVFRPDEQNLWGLALVLNDIRDDHREGGAEGRYLLVASQVIAGLPGSPEESRLDGDLAHAAEILDLLPGSSDSEGVDAEMAATEDDLLESANENVVLVNWRNELALARGPVVGRRPSHTLALDYERLAAQIWDRLEPLAPPEAAAKCRAQEVGSWSRAARNIVLQQALGETDGQADPLLTNAFVSTAAIRRALEPNVAFVVGNKGSGKSALFRILVKEKELVTRLVPGMKDHIMHVVHGDAEGVVGLPSDDLPSKGGTEADYARFWQAYIAASLEVSCAASTGAITLHALRESFKRAMSGSAEEAFDAASRRMLEKTAGRPVVLLVDTTERWFDERRPLEGGIAFRGLARAWLSWRAKMPRIKLKAFLRDPSLLDPTGTLVDRSHLQGRTVDLSWGEAEAWWFLLRRLLANLGEQPDSPIAARIIGALRQNDRPPEDIEDLRHTLETVFPDRAYPGENEAPFHRWLLDRMRDGNDKFYPRALLSFVGACQKSAGVVKDGESESVFERAKVRTAFVSAAQEHTDAFLAELGYLKPYANSLGEPEYFASAQVRYTDRELRDVFEKVHAAHGDGPAAGAARIVPPDKALEVLRVLGVLRYAPDSKRNDKHFDWELPSLYKRALAISPKGRI